MIAVSGYRASGKSEVARRLASEYDFAVYDSGPALRKAAFYYNKQCGTDLCAETFVDHHVNRTGDSDWGVQFDVVNTAAEVHRRGQERVAVVGYRSLDELNCYGERLSDLMGYEVAMDLVVVRTSFENALINFREREGIEDMDEAREKLLVQHAKESAWGMPDIEQAATEVIDNDHTGPERLALLHEDVHSVLGRLGYLGYSADIEAGYVQSEVA